MKKKYDIHLLKTPYQSAYAEFADMFCGCNIYDNNKRKNSTKSELFSYLYWQTWEEQCASGEVRPLKDANYIERNIDYALLRTKMKKALNNGFARYFITNK
jgi:hypothetical protein